MLFQRFLSLPKISCIGSVKYKKYVIGDMQGWAIFLVIRLYKCIGSFGPHLLHNLDLRATPFTFKIFYIHFFAGRIRSLGGLDLYFGPLLLQWLAKAANPKFMRSNHASFKKLQDFSLFSQASIFMLKNTLEASPYRRNPTRINLNK